MNDDSFRCIKDAESIKLIGDESKSLRRIFWISIEECRDSSLPEGEACASQEESDAYLTSKVIEIHMKTNYIDYNNMTAPIKSHLKQVVSINL